MTPGKNGFTVLVATDGSRDGRAAVAATLAFPWPVTAQVRAVIARRIPTLTGRPGYVVEAFDRSFQRVGAATRHALERRWPAAEVDVIDKRPVDAILTEARRVHAGTIVVGSRGAGMFRRLLMGSVSRGVVRRAPCPVLVVRRRRSQMRRFVVGIDGSAHARRAVEFLATLDAPRGGRVRVVRVVEPMAMPSMQLMPASVRNILRREARELDESRAADARREIDAASTLLRRSNWTIDTELRSGAPLAELLSVADATHGDVLVLGAVGAGQVERLLLGSVAEGALAHARLPVLIVR